MKRVKILLVAALAIAEAACVMSGKPKAAPPAPPPAPAPAPEPLSIPQTMVQLPPDQPVDPKALVTAPPPPETAPAVDTRPVGPAVPPKSPAPRGNPAPPARPPETAAPPEPEPARPMIQEILPAEQQRTFQRQAQSRRKEAGDALVAAERHGAVSRSNTKVQDINQLLKHSEDAEKANDMRLAAQLAERAYLLAKELEGGK